MPEIDRRTRYYYAHREEIIKKISDRQKANKKNLQSKEDIEAEIKTVTDAFKLKMEAEQQKCDMKIKEIEEKMKQKIEKLQALIRA